MRTDNHCHTSNFSFDGKMSGFELVEAAIEYGHDIITITDHYEMDYPHPQEKPVIFNLDEYFTAIAEWQEAAGDELVLQTGIELGYQPHLADIYTELVQSMPFDCVIASCHLFRGVDPYYDKTCFTEFQNSPSGREAVYHAYINSLSDMIESFAEFDILAHYDYLCRYVPYDDKKITYQSAPEAFDRLFRLLIQKNKSLELNTRSIRNLYLAGCPDFMPDKEIYLRYKELGGKYVSLSSDSHDASTMGLYFKEAGYFLKNCGFEQLTIFRNREPQLIANVFV